MPNNAYHTPSPGPLGNQRFGADYNSGVSTRLFTLTTEDGSATSWLWVNGGKLYIKTGTVAPTSATDGTVVGTQT